MDQPGLGGKLWRCILIVGTVLLLVDPERPKPAPAAGDADPTATAALAEYNAKRANMPDTRRCPLEARCLVRAKTVEGRGNR